MTNNEIKKGASINSIKAIVINAGSSIKKSYIKESYYNRSRFFSTAKSLRVKTYSDPFEGKNSGKILNFQPSKAQNLSGQRIEGSSEGNFPSFASMHPPPSL